MKTFKEYINEEDNRSIHFNEKGAISHAKKLATSGYKNVRMQTNHKPGFGTIHIVTHDGKEELKEDGMGPGAIAAGPTNVVGSGAIAGSGGKGGEPGVHPRKKRSPVMGYFKRKSPQS